MDFHTDYSAHQQQAQKMRAKLDHAVKYLVPEEVKRVATVLHDELVRYMTANDLHGREGTFEDLKNELLRKRI